MNRPTLRVALAFLLVLSASVTGCKEEPVTGGNPLDPTLPAAPCDSAYVSAVGSNGFVLSGAGYQGELIRFVDYLSDLEFRYLGTEATAIQLRMTGTISLPDSRVTPAIVDLQVPGYKPGTYRYNNLGGDSASYVRLEFRKQGGTRVYHSIEGHIILDSLVNNAQPYLRFCGLFKDSLINSRVAVMSGRFAPEP